MSDNEEPLELDEPLDEPFDLERESLDQPVPFSIDWGGDGSDLMRPVRAHVLAALRPNTGPYQPPLDVLLTLDEADAEELERVRAEYGIGQEHVPELLRMVRDRALNTADSDTTEVMAPSYALALLEDLDLSDHVAELMPLFDLDYDQVGEELMDVAAGIGAPALGPLTAYLNDRTRWAWGRSRVADTMAKLAEGSPELREPVIAALSAILADAENDHEQAVTGAMGGLIDLQAHEALPQIRHAFEVEKVDEMAYGAWGNVQNAFDVEPNPEDPLVELSEQRFKARHETMFPPDLKHNLEVFREQQQAEVARLQAERAQLQAERGRLQAERDRLQAERGRLQAEHIQLQERAATEKRKQDKVRREKSKRKAAATARKANKKKRK